MEAKEKLKKELITVFWVFIIGSIFGSIVETSLEIFIDGNLHIRRGLIYGPFIPVYGIGAVMYYFIVSNIKDTFKVFLASMALGGIVEYGCSYIQEIFFGTISWDYSSATINLNGRTDLIHCIFWGIAGVFYITMAYPVIMKFISNYTKWEFKILTAMVIVFMAFNITVSWAAGRRQSERVLEIPAKNYIDELLDKYYPDSRMDKIFSNKIVTIKKENNILQSEK
ncbi:MAG: putative ABC transporter permease [Clostridia bacterium]|nr:putative ABC transporter permease [Clostridia bacterium]